MMEILEWRRVPFYTKLFRVEYADEAEYVVW